MRVSDARLVPETAGRVRELLRVRHGIGPGQEDDFFVREPEMIQQAVLETSSALGTLLLVLAAVSMLAGGAVIMNVMLLSVSQRAHEIGLRRAVGARASDIARQFRLETLLLTLVGAAAGTVLGVVAAAGLSWAGVFGVRITWVPFAVAIGACVVLGLAFGTVPARRAARVEPAVALREQRV